MTDFSYQERVLFSRFPSIPSETYTTKSCKIYCISAVICTCVLSGLLVQLPLQSIEELCAVHNVIRQADAERVFSGHVIEQ